MEPLTPLNATVETVGEPEAPPTVAEILKRSQALTQSIRAHAPVGEVTYAMVRKAAGDEAKAASDGDLEKSASGFGLVARDTTSHSNVLPSNDDVHTIFTMAGALFPPYDPEVLVTLLEHSHALRPNFEAYATNIEAFGHRLEAAVDPQAKDAKQKIGDAIFLTRLRDQEQKSPGSATQATYPSDDEIAAKQKEIEQLARLEHAKLTNFLSHCVAEYSFTELRYRSRIDLENTGNAYWEVLRNDKGEITQFVYVPSYSVRLMPIEHRHHDYTVKQRVSLLEYEPVVMRRRFRRFVQVVLDRIVHFKEFGDERVISRKTGQQFPSVEALKQKDAADGPATELVHFKIHSPRSPYGIPRWIGVLLAVLGSRASEEVNFLYFDNKAVPPLAILVSGGKLAKESKDKIASYIKDNIKGKENFHRILIVEAEPASPTPGLTENGRVRIQLQPLKDAQQTDAQFQQYDERNTDKIGMAFRLPRLLRGDVRDFNRATADAALTFAEMQVFQPERERFDDFINRHVLTAMGIRFWSFVSQSPVNRDPKDTTTMATEFGQAGAITPNELREIAEEVFNKPFPKVTEPWGDQPFGLSVAGLMPVEDIGAFAATPPPAAGGKPGTPLNVAGTAAAPAKAATPEERRLRAVAASLIGLRGQLQKAAALAHEREFAAMGKALHDEGTIVVRLSKAQIDELFEPAAP